MFGKLPDLLGRSFAIGFFLPITTFMAATIVVLEECGLLQLAAPTNTPSQFEVLVGATVVGLISWLGGVLLLATNREVLRFVEGYGRFNPARLLHRLEKRRYRKLRVQVSQLDEEYRSCIAGGRDLAPELGARRNELMRRIVTRFPDEERWVLPTSLGNTIRAFEVYPRVMYGLDSIPGWSRLLAVIPEEYQRLVDNAKAQLDFWLNLCLLSLVLLVEYVALAAYTGELRLLWASPVALGVAFIAYSRAEDSAVRWGDFVKSAFDTFLPELRKKLGFAGAVTVEEERSLWRGFSQAVIYVRPDQFPNRDQPANGGQTQQEWPPQGGSVSGRSYG